MRDYLLATCAGFPDEVLRVLADIRANDFVFSDAIAQVEMPRITQERCALIGDAAHCPTFLSGMGSSLALQDAHVLAGCLARNPGDLATSLARYEEVMTPIACRYKSSAVSAHRALLGSGPFKARLRDVILRLMPERVFERGVRRFFDAERPLDDSRRRRPWRHRRRKCGTADEDGGPLLSRGGHYALGAFHGHSVEYDACIHS